MNNNYLDDLDDLEVQDLTKFYRPPPVRETRSDLDDFEVQDLTKFYRPPPVRATSFESITDPVKRVEYAAAEQLPQAVGPPAVASSFTSRLSAARGAAARSRIEAQVRGALVANIPKVASVDKLIRELTTVKGVMDSPETSCNTAQQILKEFDTNYMYIFKHIEKNPRYFDNPDVISQLRALEISIQNKSRKCIESKLINMYKQIFDIRGGGKRKKRNSIRLHLCSKRRKNKNKTNKKRRSRRVF
jgi:hypothetical protein